MQTNNNAVLDNFSPYTLSDAGDANSSPLKPYEEALPCGCVLDHSSPWAKPRLVRPCAQHKQVSCGTVEGHGVSKEVAASSSWLMGETARTCLTSRQVGYQAPPAGIHFVKELSSSSGLKSRKTGNNLRFSSYSGVSWRSLLFGRVATYWAELMRRTLAPLRRIVSRELEVYAYGRISAHPQSFVVHDRMECGHVHTSLGWDIFDLLNGYTESPHVRAKRHRCDECKELMQRKPMASVAAVAKAA